MKYKSGKYKKYLWLESNDFDFGYFIEAVPEIVTNKYVVVSSYDGGVLPITEEELQSGWIQIGSLVYSPMITELSKLPSHEFEECDEWYVFNYKNIVSNELEIFINYGGFSIVDPSSKLEEYMDKTWDKYLLEDEVNFIKNQQERFWKQLTKINPETYIASGDRFIFITVNSALFHNVLERIKDI